MSLLKLPFEIIEVITNELDAESLRTMMKVVPQQYKCYILASLLQRASDENRVKEYLCICKPSVDVLKECLFLCKRRGHLYIIAEVFRTTVDHRVWISVMWHHKEYFDLSSIKGLRDQDLMESVQDLIKQGHTEPAKRFLLADRKYMAQTFKLLQIYAVEQNLGDIKQFEWAQSHKCCSNLCTCRVPWFLLNALWCAHRAAERGDIPVCEALIDDAQDLREHLDLPEPDTRQLEKTMYQNAVCSLLQRLQQLFSFVEQYDVLLDRHDLQVCREQISKAEQRAHQGGLSKPETEELKKKISSMESRFANTDAEQIAKSGLSD